MMKLSRLRLILPTGLCNDVVVMLLIMASHLRCPVHMCLCGAQERGWKNFQYYIWSDPETEECSSE